MRRAITDTREKRPYEIAGAIRRALPAGDYSLEGLEDRLAVERKSLADLVGTLTHGWPRFKHELKKLAAYPCAALIIEASAEDISGRRYKGGAHPAAIFKRLREVEAIAPRLCIIWAGSRPAAKLKALAFLQSGEELCQESSKGPMNPPSP